MGESGSVGGILIHFSNFKNEYINSKLLIPNADSGCAQRVPMNFSIRFRPSFKSSSE